MKLHIGTTEAGKPFMLPPDAVTQAFAFLARRGAGKTYAASRMAEEFLRVKAQTIILDPVGNWWGLRLGADGKSKGFDIPVLGGLRGDIPLEATAGETVADTVVEHGASLILDVSQFSISDQKRFATDFCERLFQRKKASPSPIHIFIEEAQVFIPERYGKDQARMVGAFERLIRLGRNFGIGATMISQRPQSVNKNVLNQTEALFILQTNGPHERKALREWVVSQGLAVDLVEELPGLPIGTAYVWSPQWLRFIGKVKIAKKETFNASATPEFGSKHVARELAPVDLSVLQKKMAETIERQKNDDPKLLRKQIAELKQQITAKPAATRIETKTIEVPALSKSDRKFIDTTTSKLAAMIERAASITDKLNGSLAPVNDIAANLARAMQPAKVVASLPVRVQVQKAERAQVQRTITPRAPTESTGDDQRSTSKLPAGQTKIVQAVASRPDGISRSQLVTLTGLKAGSVRTYTPILIVAGLIHDDGAKLTVTPEGIATLGSKYKPLPTGAALLSHYLDKLPGGESEILKAVANAYPATITRASIVELTGLAPGSVRTYIPVLAKRELIETLRDGSVKASDELFD